MGICLRFLLSGVILLFACSLLPLKASAAAAQGSFDPAPLRAQAVNLYQQGKILESLELWHAIYRLGDSAAVRSEALVMLGDINAMFLDRKDRAIDLYEKGIALGGLPHVIARAWYNLAMLRYDRGEYTAARLAFEGYLKRFPNGPKAGGSRHMLTRLQKHSFAGKADVPPAEITPRPIPRREPNIRVALKHASEIIVTPPSGTVAGYEGRRARVMAGKLRITVQGDDICLNGRPMGASVSLLARGGTFAMGDARYAGSMSFHVREGKVLAVNTLPLERYLEGVVPCEMPDSFRPQALRAQTVAARTHALYMLLRSSERPYDVWSTTASQVYGGVISGGRQAAEAVKATRGRILVYNGAIALAFYHSHSGGVLEDDSAVWDVDMPYYRVQADPVSNSIKDMQWSCSLPLSELAMLLRSRGYPVRQVSGVAVSQRSASGRVLRVRMATDGGNIEMNSNPFRLLVGATKMKSTLCSIGISGKTILFRGRGYGHGVGMSQWGAEGMARKGAAYEAILRQYYPHTTVRALY
jgi:stage II sporulation protein D